MTQLHMLRDFERYPACSPCLPAGFRMERRNGVEGGEEYLALREKSGWHKLPEGFLEKKVLPGGLIFCIREKDGMPVASATSECSCWPEWPQPATLGQVMCLEECRGLRLGLAVCQEAAWVAAAAGYRYMGLKTDEWRIPAVKIYLGNGWRPWMIADDMPERWKALYEQLGMTVAWDEQFPAEVFATAKV